MGHTHKVEQLTEQSTTSSSFIDVPGTSLVFTPEDTSLIHVVFVSGVMRSSSTAETSAEMRLLINGTEHDLWGHQNNNAGTPNGAGFLIFERITGTVAEQTIKTQFRAATGTTYVDNVRVIAIQMPTTGVDFQWFESNGIVSTTGSNVIVDQHQWTPGTAGNYYVFGSLKHREFPSGSTSQAWLEDVGEILHPNAPSGTYYSNARDAWNPLSIGWRVNMPAAIQTINLRFTSSGSGSGSSEHRYRKIMAFREDAFDAAFYSESLSQSTTTSTSFQTKNSVTTTATPTPQEFMCFQMARISGSNSSTASKSGELRAGGSPLIRTDHRINRDGGATQGYHHMAAVGDVGSTAAAVTLDNGFLSPNGITVQCAESTIFVLRFPAKGENAPFFGMVA